LSPSIYIELACAKFGSLDSLRIVKYKLSVWRGIALVKLDMRGVKSKSGFMGKEMETTKASTFLVAATPSLMSWFAVMLVRDEDGHFEMPLI